MKNALLLLAACLALLARPAAHAQATITWGTPTGYANANDVFTSGTFVSAASAALSANTVNGVTFSSYNSTSAITYTGTRGSFNTTANSGSADYNAILNVGFFSPANGSASTLTLSGLTSGQVYRVQVWTPMWNNPYPTTLSSGNQIAMGNTANLPTYVTGTFTAVSSSQTINYAGSTGTHGLIGAASLYNITAIPEPSTYALCLGLVLLGFSALRRRR